MKVGRNDPCPCGSGKKYKKCCLAKDEAAASQRSVLVAPSGQRFMTSAPQGRPSRPEAVTWPVVRAYVPRDSVWRATGLGVAGVIRQQPDGRYASAFLVLNLEEHGLQSVFGKDDSTLAEAEDLIGGMGGLIPPWRAGTVELASEYAWGARAVSDAEGYAFPPEQLQRYFALLAPPAGDRAHALERLVGPDGLSPRELLEVIAENPSPDDLPEGKSVAIFTEVTFDLHDATEAERILQTRGPEFARDASVVGAAAFTWMPARDQGRGRPALRKVQGTLSVAPGVLSAAAGTLSMAAGLIGTLEDLLGDGLRVRHARWRSAPEYFGGLPGREASLLPAGD